MILNRVKRLYCSFSGSKSSNPPNESGKINPYVEGLLNLQNKIQKYDVAVIGGGSGGLSFCFEAQKQNLSTIVFDYVQQSPRGTKWGLGGTCVNVGCIPKKLMHRAANYKNDLINSKYFGYSQQKNIIFKWQELTQSIKMYIKSLNFSYKSSLSEKQIPYKNALATIYDRNTIIYSKDPKIIKQFNEQNILPNDPSMFGIIKAKYILIATGGRPSFLLPCIQNSNIKNKLLTSDDIFFHDSPPGKTLILGGGYIAMQCAGFLNGMGFPVQIVTRGKPLRVFDQDCAQHIIKYMKQQGVKFKIGMPHSISFDGESYIANFEDKVQKYNNILVALGRQPNTSKLNLQKVGVHVNKNNHKIIGRNQQRQMTSIQNIYALGDILDKVPQLTGTAQKSARQLAKRISLIQNKKKDSPQYKQHILNYQFVPQTVFTPLQYGNCGLSQQQARLKYPLSNIDCYHMKNSALETALIDNYDQQGHSLAPKTYYKIIIDKSQNDKILGIHYVGPQAGQVIQGFTLALQKGLNKSDLDKGFGIHPTCAQQFMHLTVLKSTGEDCTKKGC